jgi:hypothetical protein
MDEIINTGKPIHYVGRIKYTIKGEKTYFPVVQFGSQRRQLRRNFRTATATIAYGEAVVFRYRMLLDHAMVREAGSDPG